MTKSTTDPIVVVGFAVRLPGADGGVGVRDEPRVRGHLRRPGQPGAGQAFTQRLCPGRHQQL